MLQPTNQACVTQAFKNGYLNLHRRLSVPVIPKFRIAGREFRELNRQYSEPPNPNLNDQQPAAQAQSCVKT